MNPAVHKGKHLAFAYDASLLDDPDAEIFRVDHWKSRNRLSGRATGRGSTWFIDAPFGQVALRQYLRGGWAAKLSRDKYFFTTLERSRSFREFNLLVTLRELGLPVPVPVAALCEHRGMLCTCVIMTARIPQVLTLADGLADGEALPGSTPWAAIGNCIRRFHDAGLKHADLNARNILVDSEQRVFLIDFDRAVFTPGKAVPGQANLKRLKRSLVKLCQQEQMSAMESAWGRLVDAYHG